MNHLRKLALALCITVIGITAAPAKAASISLPVLVDGYALSENNFSTISSLETTTPILPVYLAGGSEARAALEFDLSALSSPIVSASLVLYFELSDALVGVHAGTGDGKITDADFQLYNPITTFDPDSIPSPTANVIDVTDYLQYLQSVAGAGSSVVFQLRELVDPDSNSFISGDYPTSSLRPRLDIVTAAVPEPGTLALLGLGFAGLGMSRRRLAASAITSSCLDPASSRVT